MAELKQTVKNTVVGLWGEEVELPAAQAQVVAALWGEGQKWARKREHARELARTREKKRWAAGNPMIAVVGAGPTFKTCKTCVYLTGSRYHKCQLRGVPTMGSATDHRVGWPACARYVGRDVANGGK